MNWSNCASGVGFVCQVHKLFNIFRLLSPSERDIRLWKLLNFMNSRTNINYMAWKTPIIDLFVYISIQIIRKKFIHLSVFGISECTEKILEFECRGKRFFYYISQPRERNDGNKTNLYSAPAASRIISSRGIRQYVASPFFLVEVRCKTAMIIEWAFSGKKSSRKHDSQ